MTTSSIYRKDLCKPVFSEQRDSINSGKELFDFLTMLRPFLYAVEAKSVAIILAAAA